MRPYRPQVVRAAAGAKIDCQTLKLTRSTMPVFDSSPGESLSEQVAVIACSCLMMLAGNAAAQVDDARATMYFEEAAELCEHEGGRLWGMSLCGPMVFADVQTGTIATNQPAPEAPRPRVLGYANAALEWGDARWSTFIWKMIPADDERDRARLFMHELFHRVQPQFGLLIPASATTPDHLDTMEGRYWLQLEWRALVQALKSSGIEQADAIRDALAFRAKRRSLFPGSEESERVVEINEGLAQYTGTVVAASSNEEARLDAIDQLLEAPEKASFVRTFAYPSGAAYGILLDAYSPGWTRRIEAGDDLAELLMESADLEAADDVEAAAERYGGPELLVAEERREAERQARIAELRRRFVDGPVLVLPRGRNASFITTGVTPIPGEGTVYPSFRVAGEWGSIEADQVLMSPDGSTLTVPGPVAIEGQTLSGEGWRVTLAEGWVVRDGRRPGDLRIEPGGE